MKMEVVPRTPPRAEPERRLVGFAVGDGAYAVGVPDVLVVLQPGAVTPHPHGTAAVVGMVEHRGRVVPLVDLRRLFGLEPSPPSRRAKWVVTARGDAWLGLVVDAVTGVFPVAAGDARPLPRLAGGARATVVKGALVHAGRFVLELDVAALAAVVLAPDGPEASLAPGGRP